MGALPRVFDAHVHIQPHGEPKARALEAIFAGRGDVPRIDSALAFAEGLLGLRNEQGIERAALTPQRFSLGGDP